MDNRDLYAVLAGILPPLLGLGLIELYIARGVDIGLIVAGLLALALTSMVIAALHDVAGTRKQRRRRQRP